MAEKATLAYSYIVGIHNGTHDEAKAFEAYLTDKGIGLDDVDALSDAWVQWQTSQIEARAVAGNPGEGTLHDMLHEVADHIDYEAKVVDAAADDIEDASIANKAEAQAEAMEDAAEAVEDAAEAARETAAEVFNETGIAQTDVKPDEELNEVVSGNPSDDDRRAVNPYSDDEQREWYEVGRNKGDEIRENWAEIGMNPEDQDYELDSPLSGEWAGESIPEIFGSWDNATEENIEAYESGYYDAVYGNSEGNKAYVVSYLLDNGQRVTMGTLWPHLTEDEANILVEQARAREFVDKDSITRRMVVTGNPVNWAEGPTMAELEGYSDQELGALWSDTSRAMREGYGQPWDQRTLDKIATEVERRGGHPSSVTSGVVEGNPAKTFYVLRNTDTDAAISVFPTLEMAEDQMLNNAELIAANTREDGNVSLAIEETSLPVVVGNPGETPLGETLPVPDTAHEVLVPVDAMPAPPTPEAATAKSANADVAPEPSHWYTKSIFGKGK